jgi:signal transduction histidine kinase
VPVTVDGARRRLGPELAADVAHAARGPFSAALPALDLLRSGMMGELSERQREALSTVERSVRRAYADSGDLAALLAALCGRIELRLTATTVTALLADAVALAGLDPSPAVHMTEPDMPPLLVDGSLTAALLAVLVRRCADAGDRDDACRYSGGHPEPDAPSIGISLEVDSDANAAAVIITCVRSGAREAAQTRRSAGPAVAPAEARAEAAEAPAPRTASTALADAQSEGGMTRPDAARPESAPVSAPMMLVGALLEAQGGRLRAQTEVVTVWLPAAPPRA